MGADKKPTSGNESLEERYKFMFNNELYTDISFIVGQEPSQKVSANKTVLSLESNVFRRMFSKTSDKKEIEIPDVDPAAFKELLRFVYCRKVRLSKDIVWSVLYAAKKYCIEALRIQCIGFIKNKVICFHNACYQLMMARSFNENKIVKLCLKVIEKNTYHAFITAIVEPKSFESHPQITVFKVGLLKNGKTVKNSVDTSNERFINIDIDTLKFLIERDTLTIDEYPLFKAVNRWAEEQCKREDLPATPENKRSVLKGAVSLIRFPLMSLEEFVAEVPDSGLLTETEQLSMFLYFTKKSKPATPFSEELRTKGKLLKELEDKNTMNIFVKTMTGKTFGIRVSPSERIEQLKEKIRDVENMPVSDQRIIFNKKVLEDGQEIQKYGIKAESTIHLILGLRAGGPDCAGCLLNSGNTPYFGKKTDEEIDEEINMESDEKMNEE